MDYFIEINNKAWEVSAGDQKWESLTGRKISYFSSSCLADERAVTQSTPFQQSCHRPVWEVKLMIFYSTFDQFLVNIVISKLLYIYYIIYPL